MKYNKYVYLFNSKNGCGMSELSLIKPPDCCCGISELSRQKPPTSCAGGCGACFIVTLDFLALGDTCCWRAGLNGFFPRYGLG